MAFSAEQLASTCAADTGGRTPDFHASGQFLLQAMAKICHKYTSASETRSNLLVGVE
jgi:hypothetical protein